VFTVFGLNGFLHLIPMRPPPAGLAGQYLGALAVSHYMAVVSTFQLLAGILLMVNRYTVLALTTLAGIIVNILLFHILMEPGGLPAAAFAAILWIASLWNVRSAFAGLLQDRVALPSKIRI
jgi:hypothetical protein